MRYDIDIDSYIGFPISYEWVKEKMAAFAGRPVSVRLCSLGGDVVDALSIMTLFRDHGDVTAYVQGMTASAATIIACGARRIVMDEHALLLVHNCSGFISENGFMNTDELTDAIERLTAARRDQETIDRVFAAIYTARAGEKKTKEELAALMAENRWIDSEEALAFGLVDEIRRPSEREKETSIVDFIAREGSHLAALSLPIPFVKENKGVKVLKVLRVLKALNPLKVEDMEEEKKEEKEEVKTVKEDDFARLEEAVNGMLAVQEKQEERLAALEALVKELEEKPAPPSDPVEVEDSYGLQQVAALDERAAKEETPRDRLSRIASIL